MAKRSRCSAVVTAGSATGGSSGIGANDAKVRGGGGGVGKNYAGPTNNAASCSSRMAAASPMEEEEMMLDEEEEEGYNSEDEYSYSHVGVSLTEEEWAEQDRR